MCDPVSRSIRYTEGERMTSALQIFDSTTVNWFENTIGTPTAVQSAAWPAIASGCHTLVSAPTGTGKTLSAFLVFIDKLKMMSRAGELKQELHLIYISPLKSLAGDIRENLRRPLDGISQIEADAGTAAKTAPLDINVALRTGDTTQSERRRIIKKPPHILITTPESLYLLLTSGSGQKMLSTARAIIIDELHALIESKRGAHLMLSIARLDRLCRIPLQRIGLSATIEPLDEAARYLSPDPVTIAAPVMKKEIRIAVTSPVPDPGIQPEGSIWPELARSVLEQSTGARSAIAFVEGRLQAEKLAYYINRIVGDGYALTHHGSVSKEQRLQAENALREGNLRILCATSSMELGIDVGDIDIVIQIGCPRSVSGTLQRLGRAGHNPGRISVMHILPRTSSEGLYCGMTARVACEGNIECVKTPKICLDVLSQHLVSMASGAGYIVDDVMEILQRAYPFKDVNKEDVRSLLRMLAGDYEHERDIPVRPRVLYDRVHDKVEGDPYSRLLALSAGGTIPDRGMFQVLSESGAKLGELDEEFVFEARVGDKFLLGAFAWRIERVQKDSVIVSPSTPEGAQPPFWKGDWSGRGIMTGLKFGAILRELYDANTFSTSGGLLKALEKLGLDEPAAISAGEFIKRQITATGVLPDDKTILVEHFTDGVGKQQIMVHSMFGRKVNAPLALLAQKAAEEMTGAETGCFDDEYGFMLFPYGEDKLPERIIEHIAGETARALLETMLPATPLFAMAFRYNTARSLMMGVRKSGRQPLWIQRLRGAEMLDSLIHHVDHPLIRETKRECMEDYWDVDGVEYVLNEIRSGGIKVREVYSVIASPMSLPLRRQVEATLLYEYSPTTYGVLNFVNESVNQVDAIIPASEQLAVVSERMRTPANENQLHSLLMAEGDIIAGEIDVPVSWLESLARQGRALYIEPGLWIAAEHENDYRQALSAAEYVYIMPESSTPEKHPPFFAAPFDDISIDAAINTEQKHADISFAVQRIVRRMLRYRGAHTVQQLAERYYWNNQYAYAVLLTLIKRNEVADSDGIYYHAKLYERARLETIKNLRKQIKTNPPESYAALLAERVFIAAPPEEQLEKVMRMLAGRVISGQLWESVVLPARVSGYRPAMLDTLLSQGEIFWRMPSDSMLSFELYDDIDWDAAVCGEEALETSTNEALIREKLHKETSASELQAKEISIRNALVKDMSDNETSENISNPLSEAELIILNTLIKRGASFSRAFPELPSEVSMHDTLMGLVGKGLVHADSFIPVRQFFDSEKLRKAPPKRRAHSRAMAISAGRWDISRQLAPIKAEIRLERAFDSAVVLSRETVTGMNWTEALEVLRVWEYTGRARRGYFVSGLSGVQFVREREFKEVMLSLENPRERIIWLNAADPAQPWGKSLRHKPGYEFVNLQNTAVALKSGAPIAVIERRGQVLRVFEIDSLGEALAVFKIAFEQRRIYSGVTRITVKEYPNETASVLSAAGFLQQMSEFVLYRSSI